MIDAFSRCACVAALLLLTISLADGQKRGKGSGVDTFLSELQTVLDTRKTDMSRMEGCEYTEWEGADLSVT